MAVLHGSTSRRHLVLVEGNKPHPVVRIHCPRPGCTYLALAQREGAAVQAIADHLVNIHRLGTKGSAA